MNTGFTIIGVFHVAAFVLGSLGAIDYHVCIKASGQCSAQTKEVSK